MDENDEEFDWPRPCPRPRNYGSLGDTIMVAKDEEILASPEGMLIKIKGSAANYQNQGQVRNYGSLKDAIMGAKDEETSGSPEDMLMKMGRSAPKYIYRGQVPIELFRANKVVVEQMAHGFGKGHKFLIKTIDGVDILTAGEEGSFIFGKDRRSFWMHVVNNQGVEVITFHRPWTWTTSKMEVYMGDQLVSLVQQKFKWLGTQFNINGTRDPETPIMRVKGGPLATHFEIQSLDQRVIGGVWNMGDGLVRVLRGLDTFLIIFPADLDLRYKVAVIGTCILLHYIELEKH